MPAVPVLRGAELGGGGGDGDDDDDDDGTGRGRFVSRGKFGLGTTRVGESSCWTRRARGTGTPDGCGDGAAEAGGRLGSGGGQVQRQEGGGKSRDESGSESAEGESTMEVCCSSSSLPSPQARPLPKAGLPLPLPPPPKSGPDGGPVVFCPRSPNKKAGAPRTPASPSAGLAEAAVGVSVAIGTSAATTAAAARGTAPPTRTDENRAPGPATAPQGSGDEGGLTGVTDACEQRGADMDLELGRLHDDVGTGVVVANEPAGASRTGTRGLLDGLPSGWSVAKGGRVLWQRRQRSEKKGGQEEDEGEGRETPQKQKQKQKQQKKNEGSQSGGRGATSRSSPLTRDNPTLMEFWKKSQGGSAGGNLGKGPEGTGLERHGQGS